MYVQSIVFQREKDSKWEKGFYVGEYDNSSKSFIMDEDYVPIQGDIWDYHKDFSERAITFRCND